MPVEHNSEWERKCIERFKHTLPNQYLWENIVWPGDGGFPEEYMKQVKDVTIRSSDTLIATYPKSGTTWLQEVVWLLHNNCDFQKNTKIPGHERIPFLEESEWGTKHLLLENNLSDMNETETRVIKTHLPFHLIPKSAIENKAKMIYCYRNVKDIAVSYYHFYRSNADFGKYTGTWENFLEMFLEGYVTWGNWFEHVHGWINNEYFASKNIMIITFEHMKKNSERFIENVAKFYNIRNIDGNKIKQIADYTTFDQMKDRPNLYPPVCDNKISPFMRKGKIGDWKNHFTVAQNEIMDNVIKEYTSKDIIIPMEFE